VNRLACGTQRVPLSAVPTHVQTRPSLPRRAAAFNLALCSALRIRPLTEPSLPTIDERNPPSNPINAGSGLAQNQATFDIVALQYAYYRVRSDTLE